MPNFVQQLADTQNKVTQQSQLLQDIMSVNEYINNEYHYNSIVRLV